MITKNKIRVSIGAIIDKEGRLLLEKRSFLNFDKGKWAFPGGKIEKGEDEKQTLVRELYEETGICVDYDDVIYISSYLREFETKDIELNIHLVKSQVNEPFSKESQEIGWFTIKQALSLESVEGFSYFLDQLIPYFES